MERCCIPFDIEIFGGIILKQKLQKNNSALSFFGVRENEEQEEKSKVVGGLEGTSLYGKLL